MANPSKKRLTKEQRNELTRRVMAGERPIDLSAEFGVTPAYVSLLKAQELHPERYILKQEKKLEIKLSRAEQEKFSEVVSTSTPEELGLIPAKERWTLDHGFQLAWKLFKKRPSVRAVKEVLAPYMKRTRDDPFSKPTPPKPHHINQLDPELAKDPEFVAYYLSPICAQIAQREYELALADWEQRTAKEEARKQAIENNFPQPAPPQGRRVGKHAKSKGNPFTPPKRRKKR